MHFTNAIFTLLPLTALVSAAPVPDSSATPSIVAITGLPAADFPDPEYITYTTDFFGDLTLQPTTNKSAAVAWTVNSNSDLVSASSQSIALHPLTYAPPTAQSVGYVAYNGSQGTYVDGDKVLNRDPNFGTWRFCESQYGASLEYETPGFNNSNAGMPFPCYPVEFVLTQ